MVDEARYPRAIAVNGITIAIPTHNRARLLRRTLESLARISTPPGTPVELLIINNNCTDHTPAVVSELAPQLPFPVRMVVEHQPGLNHGRNRALSESAYEHIVYFDDDVEVSRGWLEGYCEGVERLQADCVVGPVNPVFEQEIPPYMTPVIIASLSSPYSTKGDLMMRLADDVAHEVPGCNFGVRKPVATEIGGFSAELDRVGSALLAGGDSEFGARLARAGKRVVYQPRCSIAHIISPEKLEKEYLRRRWRGTGATVRRLESPGHSVSLARRARQWLGVGRLFAAAAWWTLAGRKSRSFERELEAFKALGYVTGR